MPAPIKLEALSVAMDELGQAWTRKQEANDDYKTMCDAVAESSGLDASVVKAYVNARMSDKFAEKKTRVEQLSLCFESVT